MFYDLILNKQIDQLESLVRFIRNTFLDQIFESLVTLAVYSLRASTLKTKLPLTITPNLWKTYINCWLKWPIKRSKIDVPFTHRSSLSKQCGPCLVFGLMAVNKMLMRLAFISGLESSLSELKYWDMCRLRFFLDFPTATKKSFLLTNFSQFQCNEMMGWKIWLKVDFDLFKIH